MRVASYLPKEETIRRRCKCGVKWLISWRVAHQRIRRGAWLDRGDDEAMHGVTRSGGGNHGPGAGGGKAAGAIRSHWLTGWAAPLAVVSWMASMRAVRRGGLGVLAAVAVVLSAQSAVLASSAPAPAWTKQHPVTHPPARWARRWPTTRPPATSSCSAATTQSAFSMTPGPGTARPGPSSTPRPARPPGAARRWPTTRPPATSSCSAVETSKATISATPGPGTGRPGRSRPPRPARPPADDRVDGLRRGHPQHRLVRRQRSSYQRHAR